MKAAIYTRISVHDEDVDKTQNQEAACRKHAAQKGYVVSAVYCDDGISASTFKHRPAYSRMMADAQAGKFDVLVASAEDRLSRQPKEKLMLLAACEEGNVLWDTVRDGAIDPASDEAELFSYFRGWTARKEQRVKADNQRKANVALVAKGMPLMSARPFGFKGDKIQHEDAEAAEIKWAYAQILSGSSIYSVLKSFNERGIKTSRGNMWTRVSLLRLLARTSNAAIVPDNVVAQWLPIVSKDDFEAANAILAVAHTAQRPQRWLLAGIAQCGVCGQPMASSAASWKGQRHTVYLCSSKRNPGGDNRRHCSIRTDDLDPLVIANIVSVFLLGSANVIAAPELADISELHKRLSEIRQALADLVSLIGLPGFNKANTAKRGAELSAEEKDIESDLELLRRNNARVAMLIESRKALFAGDRVSIKDASLLKIALKARFESLPLEQQRVLVRSLLTVIVHPYVRKGNPRSIDRVEFISALDADEDIQHEDIEDLEPSELLLK
jgi:site-specific DNA recombinase